MSPRHQKLCQVVLILLQATLSRAQQDTSWIPFRLRVMDGPDTIARGLDFFLTKGYTLHCPSFNDSLQCYEFRQVDSLVAFHLIYKDRHFRFKEIAPVSVMAQREWLLRYDPAVPDTCYQVYGERGGWSGIQIAPEPGRDCLPATTIQTEYFRPCPRRKRNLAIDTTRKQLRTKTRIIHSFNNDDPGKYDADTSVHQFDPDGYEMGMDELDCYPVPDEPLSTKEEVLYAGNDSTHIRRSFFYPDDTNIYEQLNYRLRLRSDKFCPLMGRSLKIKLALLLGIKAHRQIHRWSGSKDQPYDRADTVSRLRFLIWSWERDMLRRRYESWRSFNSLTRWEKRWSYNDSLNTWFVSGKYKMDRKQQVTIHIQRFYNIYWKEYFSDRTYYRYDADGNVIYERKYDPYLKVTEEEIWYSYDYY